MIHAKFRLNIHSHSGENIDFIGLAIFSIDDHPGFSTRLNYQILKPCSLVMRHVKLDNHGCSGFRE